MKIQYNGEEKCNNLEEVDNHAQELGARCSNDSELNKFTTSVGGRIECPRSQEPEKALG